jgi:tetratricopeptide (TPR) repeat protein
MEPNPSQPDALQDAQRIQRALNLTDEDIASIHTAPTITQQRQHQKYQKDLALYERLFTEMAQRRFPLGADDNQDLNYLQRFLQLRSEDVQAIEAKVTAQIDPATTLFTEAPQPEASTAATPAKTNLVSPADSYSSPISLPDESTPTPISSQVTPPPSSSEPPAAPDNLEMLLAANLGNSTKPLSNRELLVMRLIQLLEEEQAHPNGDVPTTLPPTELRPVGATMQPDMPGVPGASNPVDGLVPPMPSNSPAEGYREPSPSRVEAITSTRTVTNNSSQTTLSSFLASLLPWLIGVGVIGAIAAGTWAALNSFKVKVPLPFGKQTVAVGDIKTTLQSGIQKMQENRFNEGIELFDRVLATDSKNTSALINRGMAYHRLNRVPEAIRDYDQAITLLLETVTANTGNRTRLTYPELAIAYSNRSHAHYDQKNYEQALKDANLAVDYDPRLATAPLNLANAQLARGDRSGALKSYNKGISMQPNQFHRARAHNNRGNLYREENRLRDAILDYDQAIQLDETYADAWRNRGLAREQNGDRQGAETDLRQAATLYETQGNRLMNQTTLDELARLQQGVSPSTRQTSSPAI